MKNKKTIKLEREHFKLFLPLCTLFCRFCIMYLKTTLETLKWKYFEMLPTDFNKEMNDDFGLVGLLSVLLTIFWINYRI